MQTIPNAASASSEKRAVSSLNHPNICTLHDVGTEEGVDYLVMEYIEGETLELRLERGPLPLSEALEHAVQICDALAKAHQRGVVHGDLKPANVMLTKSGLKLLDFGLAARATSTGGYSVENAALDSADELTMQRTVMGTLPYMAPEQIEGKQADVRTDLFAFGALVYEMITGTRAFKAASQIQLIGAILKDHPQPITELVPDVPVSVARTVARCLSKDPADRWQTASDLLFHLRDTPSPLPATDSGPPRRQRLLRRVERAAWIAAILGTIAGVLLWPRSRNTRTGDSVPAAVPIAFAFLPAEGTAFSSGYDVPFALSPDGQYFVYVGVKADGSRQLWLRPLSSELAQPMPGTGRFRH